MADFEQVNFRMPAGMRDHLKEMARRNRRTMGSEVIFHLERALLINEARILFGDNAAAELAAKAATTGDNLAGTAPAVARNETALAGGPIHQR